MADQATKKVKNWWWPTISDQSSAIEASKAGFWAALSVAVITALFATIALVTHKEIASVNVSAYVDAVLFSIIAWRIKNYSKIFAVVGVVLFLIEKGLQFQSSGAQGLPLAIILLLMFVSGARGVFAYHRYEIELPQIESL